MSTPRTARRAPAGAPPGGSPGSRRSRPLQIAVVAASVALLAVAAVIFIVRSGGGSSSSTSKKKSVSANVKLALGGVDNANGGAPATLPDDAANQIMQVVGQYVDQGLIAPVKTGQPAKDLSSLFDAGSQEAIKGPDKDTLFENGQPKRTGDFKPSAQPVVITALSDANGQFVLATAAFTYDAEVGVQGGTLTTSRSIALTFSPDNGQWKITGYDVTVARQGAGVEVPTSTAATQP